MKKLIVVAILTVTIVLSLGTMAFAKSINCGFAVVQSNSYIDCAAKSLSRARAGSKTFSKEFFISKTLYWLNRAHKDLSDIGTSVVEIRGMIDKDFSVKMAKALESLTTFRLYPSLVIRKEAANKVLSFLALEGLSHKDLNISDEEFKKMQNIF